VIVLVEMVHLVTSAEVKTTVKPLDEVAEITYVPLPKVLLFSELKVIVCEALAIVKVNCAAVEPRWLVDSE